MWQLLWKDYRQAWPALFGCWLILLMLIGICYLQLFFGRPMNSMQDSLWCALIAPTLAAMACSGLLIGHERQTGAWNWSSSLPIDWRRALLSKTIVWAIASLVMFVSLLAIFGVMLELSRFQGLVWGSPQNWPNEYTYLMAAVIIPLEVYVCFSLAALLFQDTLAALVLAGIFVAAGHGLLADITPRLIWQQHAPLLDLGIPGTVGILLVLSVLVGGGGVVLARVFRWRWGTGQGHMWRGLTGSINEGLLVQPLLWHSFRLQARQPSQGLMLLWHAAQSSVGLRILVAITSLLVLVIAPSPAEFPLVPVLLMAAGLLGLSVFTGDQTRGRYRFLADRGVDWRSLLVGHMLIPLAMLLIIWGLFVLSGKIERHHWRIAQHVWLASSLLALFDIGILCSLCVPSSLLATCVLAATALVTTLWLGMVNEFWSDVTIFQILPLFQILVPIICLPWLTVALVRRWLVGQRPPGLKTLVAGWFALALAPLVLDVHTAFLTQPVYSWQGMPFHEIKIHSSRPGLTLPFDRDAQLVHNWGPVGVQSSYEATQPIHTLWSLQETGMAKKLQIEIDHLNKRLDEQSTGRVLAANQAELLNQTALWAFYATRNYPDRQLAIAAWKLNRRLGAMIDFGVLSSVPLMRARLNSDMLRYALTNDQWAWLAEAVELKELLHEPVPSWQLKQIARMSVSAVREAERVQAANASVPPFLSSWNLAYGQVAQDYAHPHSRPTWILLQQYPPMRWLYHRQLSSVLANELSLLDVPDLEMPYHQSYSVLVGLHQLERILVRQAGLF